MSLAMSFPSGAAADEGLCFVIRCAPPCKGVCSVLLIAGQCFLRSPVLQQVLANCERIVASELSLSLIAILITLESLRCFRLALTAFC